MSCGLGNRGSEIRWVCGIGYPPATVPPEQDPCATAQAGGRDPKLANSVYSYSREYVHMLAPPVLVEAGDPSCLADRGPCH